MGEITLKQAVSCFGKAVVQGKTEARISGWTINNVSATKPGYVFFLDSKHFSKATVESAFKNGARAVVVDKAISLPYTFRGRALIRVPNVTSALMRLIRLYRAQFKIPVIGITGSVGKSTTTEMVSAILKQRWPILKTIDNANLTWHIIGFLSRLKPKHKAAVFEMGMDKFGEIAGQCFMAKPNIGVITRIAEAHVGNLKNDLANVVKAKQELIDGMKKTGLLILNKDDPNTKKFNLSKFKGKVKYFSIRSKADVWASDIREGRLGTTFKAHIRNSAYTFKIPVLGQHNVANAMAATAVALSLGFSIADIKKGLAKFRAPKWRLQLLKGAKGSLLINDCYNANPTSMCAGIDVLASVAKKQKKKTKTIAVLGTMAELGKKSEEGHKRVGRYVVNKKIDYLYTVGVQAKEIAKAAEKAGMPRKRIKSYLNTMALLSSLPKQLNANTVVLFKSSRVLRMERLVKQLSLNKEKNKAKG